MLTYFCSYPPSPPPSHWLQEQSVSIFRRGSRDLSVWLQLLLQARLPRWASGGSPAPETTSRLQRQEPGKEEPNMEGHRDPVESQYTSELVGLEVNSYILVNSVRRVIGQQLCNINVYSVFLFICLFSTPELKTNAPVGPV